MNLGWRILIFLLVTFACGFTARNGSVAFGEGMVVYMLVVMPYFWQRREPRILTRHIRIRDPYGFLAKELHLPWLGPRAMVVTQVQGTKQEIRAFRQRAKRIARGEE